jgi:hypothetical protein
MHRKAKTRMGNEASTLVDLLDGDEGEGDPVKDAHHALGPVWGAALRHNTGLFGTPRNSVQNNP